MWSGDLALSILIFSAMSVVVFMLVTNAFDDTSLDDVTLQATNGARYLSEEGFPRHWVADDVIRVGILSEGEVSLRKLSELVTLPVADLRSKLRVTDHFVLYATNGSGTVIPLSGACSLGDIVIAHNESNSSLRVLAVVHNVSGEYPVVSGVASRVNLTISTMDSAIDILDRYDIIIIEGNISADVKGSPDLFSFMLSSALKRGVTLVILGDPGTGFAGLLVNQSAAASLQFSVDDGTALGFPTSEEVLFPSTMIPVALPPSGAFISHYASIATTDVGDDAAVTYLYDDSRVYYLGTTIGTATSGPLSEDLLIEGLSEMAVPSTPVCDRLVIPSDATDVSHASRLLPLHDDILTLHLVVWRTP